MATRLRTQATQVAIGIALAMLPFLYFIYTDVSWQPLNPHEHVIQNGLAYLFLLLFSYCNHILFVPRWFLTKQYRRYVIITMSCLLCVVYLPFRMEQWAFLKPPPERTALGWASQLFLAENVLPPPGDLMHSPPNEPRQHADVSPPPDVIHSLDGPFPPRSRRDFHPRGPARGLHILAKLAICFLLGSVSTLLSASAQTANRLRQVENDRLQAELQQLKAQIQPHFLFNTLNSIYALAVRNDSRTADTIVKLAEFMRYIISDAHGDRVPLAMELNYIANYIDLQKARLRDAVQLDYRCQGQDNGLQIAPLLLFSFIENAFKYGVSPEEDSPIVIHVTIEDQKLRLHVANNKVQVGHLDTSTTVGLHNARERLRLLYPAAYELTIDDTPTHFRVTLRLTL